MTQRTIGHAFMVAITALAIVAAGVMLSAVANTEAHAQSSSCQASASAPTYTPGLKQLSCDLNGNLRTSGGGGGGGAVDITAVGGNPVTTALPVEGLGTAGTPVGGVLTIQGEPSMEPLSTDTDLTAIGGNAVSVTTPGILDINCASGCVAGSGVVNGVATAAAPTYVDGTDNPLSLDLAGNLRVLVGNSTIAVTQSGTWNIGTVTTVAAVTAITNALPAGNNNIGDVDAIQSGTWTVQPGNTPNTSPWLVTNVPPTTQADTLSSSAILANSTNSTLVKNGPGSLFEITVYNETATIAWLKFYNSASAPTCGSGTPVARYLIPGAASGGAGSNVSITVGKEFTTGIGYCVTGVITDADTTAVTANDYVVNLTYK